MSLVWNPIGTAGLAAAAVAFGLAGVVFATAPSRPQNRALAAVLFLEGVTDVFGGGLVHMTDSPAFGYAVQATAFLAFGVLTFAYLWFLGTLPSSVARLFRGRAFRVGLLIGALVFAAGFMLRPALFLEAVRPMPGGGMEYVPGPLTLPVLILPSFPVLLVGLVVALAMWRNASPASVARRQGALYALAFGVRDAGWIAFMVLLFLLETGMVVVWMFNAALLFSYVVLAYGILKTQMLDIDLKVKWTVRRGTVVAALAVVFFLVEETMESLLPFEGVIPGLLGAGAIALVAWPLWRLAGRVTERLMPAVRDTPEYRLVRKREVYLAALESAWQDGGITHAERSMLATLADQLGLSSKEASDLERGLGPGAV